MFLKLTEASSTSSADPCLGLVMNAGMFMGSDFAIFDLVGLDLGILIPSSLSGKSNYKLPSLPPNIIRLPSLSLSSTSVLGTELTSSLSNSNINSSESVHLEGLLLSGLRGFQEEVWNNVTFSSLRISVARVFLPPKGCRRKKQSRRSAWFQSV